jgi:hypothetical protein
MDTIEEARAEAYRFFDRLWKGKAPPLTRSQAHIWLMRVLRLHRNEADVRWLSKTQCETLVQLAKRDFPQTLTIWDRLLEDE